MQTRKNHVAFRKKKKKRSRLFFVFIVILLTGLFFWNFDDIFPKKVVAPISVESAEPEAVAEDIEIEKEIETLNVKTEEQLTQEINLALSGHPSTVASVSFIDLGSGKVMNFGTQEPFTAASTTKLLTAACFLDQVEKGVRSLTEMMGGYQAKWQLKQMINRSNNESWELFNTKLGYTRINDYGKNLGLSSLNFYKNTITASDQALFLKKIYNGGILSQENRDLMLSYMQKTNNEDLIPSGLPGDTVLYHKYGALDRNLHDGAIIKKGDKTFVLTIYTNSERSLNYDQRMKLFQTITQSVYSFIN